MFKAGVGIAVISGVVGLATLATQGTRSQDPGASRDNPVRVGGDVKEPTRIHNVVPTYPPGASTGRVILELTVSPEGIVEGARVIRPLEGATQAAVDAAMEWVYEPMILNGEPVWFVLVAMLRNPPTP